jgi:hypothetical protein
MVMNSYYCVWIERPFGPRSVFVGVGVLHKVQVQSGGLEGLGGLVRGFLVEAFIEETAGVAEYFGLDDEDVWDGG